jgi:hypothetical protein
MTTEIRDLAGDRRVIDRLVIEATEDWLGFFVIYGVLRKATGGHVTVDNFADAAMPVLRRLVTEFGIRPGDLEGRPPLFVPWSTSSDESLDRIERELRALDHEPLSDEICWFSAE